MNWWLNILHDHQRMGLWISQLWVPTERIDLKVSQQEETEKKSKEFFR